MDSIRSTTPKHIVDSPLQKRNSLFLVFILNHVSGRGAPHSPWAILFAGSTKYYDFTDLKGRKSFFFQMLLALPSAPPALFLLFQSRAISTSLGTWKNCGGFFERCKQSYCEIGNVQRIVLPIGSNLGEGFIL